MFNHRLIKRFTFFISLALIILLFSQTNLLEISHALFQVSLVTLVFLLLLQLLTLVLVTLQWKILFESIHEDVSFRRILMMNFVGTFYESLTPAMKSGGEAFKVYYLKKHHYTMPRVSSVLITQKTVSFITFFILLSLSLVYFSLFNRIELFVWITLIFFSVLIFILILVIWIVLKVPSKKAWFNELKSSLGLMLKRPKYLLISALVGFFIWGLFAYKFYVITSAFNLSVSFFDSGALTFIPYSIGLLPLSPGGLGTFEASMTYLLYPNFSSYGEALSITILFRFISHWFIFLLASLSLLFAYFRKDESHE